MRELLTAAGLPVEGVAESLDQFWVARLDGELVGAAGMELDGDAALLRSVAVAPGARGDGLAARLVERVATAAAELGVTHLYLLTNTAERYFPRLGFEVIARSDVPDPVRHSVEFTLLCPAAATAMRRRLAATPRT